LSGNGTSKLKLIPGDITCSLAHLTYFLFSTLAVVPLIIFLATAPFHITDTGTGNLFISIAFRTNFIDIFDHDHTSTIHLGTNFEYVPSKLPASYVYKVCTKEKSFKAMGEGRLQEGLIDQVR
jgi:hypothetical protein